ncbi:MAG: hypothetical protein A2007_02545 [Verrucomicrobia bacterium GWC2_42_7]|nr:MAG: hypothetical protein A2007_02545 [Verrucomicrobia bacterium GWC2_42_7]
MSDGVHGNDLNVSQVNAGQFQGNETVGDNLPLAKDIDAKAKNVDAQTKASSDKFQSLLGSEDVNVSRGSSEVASKGTYPSLMNPNSICSGSSLPESSLGSKVSQFSKNTVSNGIVVPPGEASSKSEKQSSLSSSVSSTNAAQSNTFSQKISSPPFSQKQTKDASSKNVKETPVSPPSPEQSNLGSSILNNFQSSPIAEKTVTQPSQTLHELAREIINKLQVSEIGSAKEVKISLNSTVLPGTEVSIKKDGDSLSVSFVCSNPDTRYSSLLNENRDALKAQLSDHLSLPSSNVTVTVTQVSKGQETMSQGGGFQNQGQNQGQNKQGEHGKNVFQYTDEND